MDVTSGSWESMSQVVDPGFKICQKLPKNAILGVFWVPRMFVEGAICIGPNVDHTQMSWGTVE